MGRTIKRLYSVQAKTAESEEQLQAASVSCRLAQAVINTLAGFVDWINMSYIAAENGLLLQLLCLLLNDSRLQLAAAECLLVITSRKVSTSLVTVDSL